MQQLWKKITEIYIMALRAGPKPQKCNVSNHGIAHMELRSPDIFQDK